VPAYNGRAWLRATCSDEKYRDGASAVEDATTACELMSWNDFQSLETLAAAYAEAGDFVEAVDCQEKAIELAHDDKKEGCRIRLKLYKEGKPNVDSTRR
jgi:tetratricopeptide (TPR) repeat protein